MVNIFCKSQYIFLLRFIVQDQYHDILKERYKTALVIAVEVTNVLQTINFSCNFVLYYILNINFRRGIHDIFRTCFASMGMVERRGVRSLSHTGRASTQSARLGDRRPSSLIRPGSEKTTATTAMSHRKCSLPIVEQSKLMGN